MTDFRLGSVPSSSILHVYSMRDSIWFDPPYQRLSDIWPADKRRLLIDSIINGYDLPKLYFHEFFPAKDVDGRKFKFAIVDGKQRLQTIFSFIEGGFALDEEMTLVEDQSLQVGGLTYSELAKKFPDLKTRFDGYVLPIVTILTDEVELIEDMFSRLNEAVPLNAAEKRNAFGGPLPIAIKAIAEHEFFRLRLPFSNLRYRHLDLATKFLYISSRGALIDTKKAHLDEFVRSAKSGGIDIAAIQDDTIQVLTAMSRVFVEKDALLKSVGSVTVFFFLFLEAAKFGWTDSILRRSFVEFDQERVRNRAEAEAKDGLADFRLLEYDRLSQSPNDGTALRYRYAVLREHVGPEEGRPTVPDD